MGYSSVTALSHKGYGKKKPSGGGGGSKGSSGGGGGSSYSPLTGQVGSSGGGRSKGSSGGSSYSPLTGSVGSSSSGGRSRKPAPSRGFYRSATPSSPLRPQALRRYVADPPSGSPLARVLSGIEKTTGTRPKVSLARRRIEGAQAVDRGRRVRVDRSEAQRLVRGRRSSLRAVAATVAAAKVPPRKDPRQTARIASNYAQAVVKGATRAPRNTEPLADSRRQFARPNRSPRRAAQLERRRNRQGGNPPKRQNSPQRVPQRLREAQKIASRNMRSRSRKVKVGVPESVPEQYRKYVAKFGTKFMDEATRGTGLTGPEYLAALIDFETGGTWDPSIANPTSGAFGLGQFMDYTAESFRSQYGVDPTNPKDPKSQIKAAAMHASGDFGHPALYAGYNPGYSDTDPIIGRAQEIAGNASVKLPRKAVKGARVAGGTAAPEKQKGEWGGSQRIIRELIGPYAKTEDWKDKENRGYSSLHDISSKPLGFAADLPANEKIVDEIARNLDLDPKEVNYGTKGLESGITYKGYDIEFLPYTHGSGPHVHIGAEWTGGSAPSGTVAGGSVSSGSSVGVSVPGAPASVPSSATGAGGALSDVAQRAASGQQGSRAAARDLYLMLSGGGQAGGGGFTRSPLAARAPLPAQYRNIGARDDEVDDELYRMFGS